jgi:hypothetical protein
MSYQREALGADVRYQQQASGRCWDTVKLESVPSFYCEGRSALTTSKEPSFWDKFTSGLTAAAQIRGSGTTTTTAGGMPSWLLPVGVGVVAIGAVLLLTKKKKSPAPAATPAAAATSNPGRQRKKGLYRPKDKPWRFVFSDGYAVVAYGKTKAAAQRKLPRRDYYVVSGQPYSHSDDIAGLYD